MTPLVAAWVVESVESSPMMGGCELTSLMLLATGRPLILTMIVALPGIRSLQSTWRALHTNRTYLPPLDARALARASAERSSRASGYGSEISLLHLTKFVRFEMANMRRFEANPAVIRYIHNLDNVGIPKHPQVHGCACGDVRRQRTAVVRMSLRLKLTNIPIQMQAITKGYLHSCPGDAR
jgi:hypothetical protein